jgi:RNA polymerase sigma-70 factor (ECF subfamily)
MAARSDLSQTAGAAGLDAELALEEHRVQITGYCYRMLGSAADAEDAAQETLTRAWKSLDRFEGRSSLRTWLFRIATNVCFDSLDAGRRRARPMDLNAAGSHDSPIGAPLPETSWVLPAPDGRVIETDVDPADQIVARESIRLAFVAALQHLPPRQRAVLILQDVLRWRATEVAQLLDTTVASVNSALQRARATLESTDLSEMSVGEPVDRVDRELLDRYVDAFERYDMELLTALVHEDATQSMPPLPLWLRGREDVLTFWQTQGHECAGSKLVPTVANGMPAFGQYRPSGPNGEHRPWALQVLHIEDGQVVEFAFFLDTDRLFPLFGLPPTPDA